MNAICITCGTQFSDAPDLPRTCAICEDERQYVGLNGQQWTTLAQLRTDHRIIIEEEEPRLSSFRIEPHFGIGQRAFLIQTDAGNLLWDCISLPDDVALSRIRDLGGIQAIAISHPHYYTTMVEWSSAFEDAPIFLHADDAEWVMREGRSIQFWTGETKELPGGLTAIRCGGHFAGATVLHWPSGGEAKGALLTADTIQVAPDRRSVSFMWSYPNYIPLGSADVRQIAAAMEPFRFDRLYGAFPKMTIPSGGKAVIARSVERYLSRITRGQAPQT